MTDYILPFDPSQVGPAKVELKLTHRDATAAKFTVKPAFADSYEITLAYGDTVSVPGIAGSYVWIVTGFTKDGETFVLYAGDSMMFDVNYTTPLQDIEPNSRAKDLALDALGGLCLLALLGLLYAAGVALGL